MNVTQKKEYQYMPFITKELEDLQGGVSIALAELDKNAGDCVAPGAFVGIDENGLGHILIAAVLFADATDAELAYKVKKGHFFSVGKVATCGDITGAKAYKIASIDRTSAEYDLISLEKGLGVGLTAGQTLHEVKAVDEAGGGSELKYVPEYITKREVDITLSHASVGALVRGTVNVANMAFGAPKVFRDKMPLIRFK